MTPYTKEKHMSVLKTVTQPLSALRHSMELSSLLLKHFSDDGLVPTNPVLVVSDGGPDHRITYASVQVALLCLFVYLDLDMLVVARTCPYQSWQNIAERIMSTLNPSTNECFSCEEGASSNT